MNRAKIIAFLKTYKFLGKNFNRDLTFVKRKKNKKRKKKMIHRTFKTFIRTIFRYLLSNMRFTKEYYGKPRRKK